MNEQELAEIEAKVSKMQRAVDVIFNSDDSVAAQNVISFVGYDAPHYFEELIAEVRRLQQTEAYLTRAYRAINESVSGGKFEEVGTPRQMIDYIANAAVVAADALEMAQEDISELKARLESDGTK